MHYKLKAHKLRFRRFARRFEKQYRHHPKALPVAAVLVLLFISAVSLVALRDSRVALSKQEPDSKIVILHSDKQTRVLPTREKTVGELLENAGIELNEGDVVEPAQDTEIVEDDFRVNVYRASPVVIHDGENRTVALSAAQTSRSIADQAGITVYPEDEVTTEPSRDYLKDGIGSKVTINRSTPVVLNLYGTSLPTRTHSETVGDLLNEKGVVLADGDTVNPAPGTVLDANTQIFVTRFGVQVVTAEEEIAMPEESIVDESLSFGASAVRQQGAPGKKSVTYEIEMKNGVETGRKIIQEVVIQEPVKHIVVKGKAVSIPSDKTAVMNAAGISPSDHVYVNYIVSRESGWNTQSSNRSSGAYGLCQALPGGKMASAGSDWQTNPVTQLKWCNGYAVGRYGSWENAYNTWVTKHWW